MGAEITAERIAGHALPVAPFRPASVPLPARLRPHATLGVLDATEWYGETSGGIRTYLHEKARFVNRHPEFRQSIVVPGAVDAMHDDDGVRTFHLRGPSIPRHRPYRMMLSTRSLARIVRHERPDIIESGSPFMVPWLLAPEARRLGIPMVCFHHTDLAGVLSRTVGTRYGLQKTVASLSWRYLRQLDRHFGATIVATRSGAAELEQHGLSNVVHVPLGVDVGMFSPDRRALRDEVRAALGLPDTPLAAFVGRFAREKELDVVLDGWSRVEQHTGARLLLVGAGPEEARLKAHAYGPRVFFLPFIQDRVPLANLLAAIDLYVAAGPAETFGLSAVEAMATGTPVLTANRGAVAEHVLRSDGGQLYEAGNPASVALVAEKLLSGTSRGGLREHGERAHRFAVTEHAWDTVLHKLFTVYRNVAAAHGR